MLDWLNRYCTVDEGGAYDQPCVVDDWAVATDRRTMVAVRLPDPAQVVGLGFATILSASRMEAAVKAIAPESAIECDLADLLRFCGYVEREACHTCFGNAVSLYQWTLDRPVRSQIGHCVDCYQSNGWITPAAPSDTRKAIVAGVTVCMSRLAWSIPPELVEPGARVNLWCHHNPMLGYTRKTIVIDDAAGGWRVMVAGCDIIDAKATPPTFHPDPLFAQLWQAARDDQAAMAALSDWLSDRNDAFAEVLYG